MAKKVEARRKKRAYGYHAERYVGWSAKEKIWLEAALTLPALEFFAACKDIAFMSRRTVDAVTQMALSLAKKKGIEIKKPAPALPAVSGPDKAMLMAGRARTRRRPVSESGRPVPPV